MSRQERPAEPLPACVTEYIDEIIRRMRYSRSARHEVRQELTDHFTDALADCADPAEREKLAEDLIAEFGDAKMLATLLRRAKKRNRPPLLKALIRAGQALLILIGVFILYTAWFVTGRPTINTNYLAVLSDKMRPQAPESQNAWPFYREAMLKIDMSAPMPHLVGTGCSWEDPDRDPASLPDDAQAMVRKWLEQNEPAWQAFVAGSRKPYCWYDRASMAEFQWEHARAQAARRGETPPPPPSPATQPHELAWKDAVWTSLLPSLGTLRHLAKVAVYKSRVALAAGQPREALEYALIPARVGRQWQNPDGYVVIEQLVGIAISSLACHEVARLASSDKLAAADLRYAQDELESLYPDGFPAFGFEAERLGLADLVQRCFTQGGPGGGHPIPRMFALVAAEPGWHASTAYHFSRDAYVTTFCLVHAGRDETLEVGNAYFDRLDEASKLTPYQQKNQPSPDKTVEKIKTENRWRYLLLTKTLPSLHKASELCWRSRAEYEATLTVLALQRYRLDKGQYPPSLDALVQAGYLRQVPLDPYSAGPLVYRVTDGTFTLYSVSINFVDDGGAQDPDGPRWHMPRPLAPDAQPGEETEPSGAIEPSGIPKLVGGDYVFWPVAPLKRFPVPEEY